MPSQPIRVAAVPAAHPYVRAIAPDDGSVLLLPDPVVDPAHPHRWWPPAMLDATWIAAHARSLDVMHVHFGMESLQPGRLEGALDALEAHGIPLVYTVHDLENPQLEAQDAHRRDLDLLVPRAARLVTLTHAAAGRIRETWGREATVVAHPTLLDGVAPPTSTVTRPATIGIHLRDVRPSIDATGSVRSLLATLDDLRAEGVDAVGRILVNDATRDPGVADRIAALVRGRTDCELVRRPRPDDDALVSEVDRLDVAWLPYAHGTHSGWVELCFDRAVQVVGPADLPMSEQHADEYHAWSADGSATSAVRHALALATRAGSEERIAAVEQRLHLRRSERKAVRAAHAAIYRDQMTDSERPTEIHE